MKEGQSDLPALSVFEQMQVGDGDTMKEIWKDIFGFNGKYQISNFGNVKSKTKDNYKQQTKQDGYKVVTLFDGDYKRTISVHRLVALHFIPNPGMLSQVNHIDGNKNNNREDNLEWCTQTENANHAVRLGLMCPHNGRKIIGIDKDGNEFVFESAAEAGRKLSINPGSINSVCTGHNKYRHTAGGYKWRYAD